VTRIDEVIYSLNEVEIVRGNHLREYKLNEQSRELLCSAVWRLVQQGVGICIPYHDGWTWYRNKADWLWYQGPG
jgi:hypothetical protein